MPLVQNIFSNIPILLPDELFQDLLKTKNFRVERIVSKGHRSPDGFWYDQDKDEWIVLLQGSAGLLFEGCSDIVTLNAGDYTNIASHVRHRVAWTDADQETIWLAIHY